MVSVLAAYFFREADIKEPRHELEKYFDYLSL